MNSCNERNVSKLRIEWERKQSKFSRNLSERFGNRDTFDGQIRSERQILFLSSRSSPSLSFARLPIIRPPLDNNKSYVGIPRWTENRIIHFRLSSFKISSHDIDSKDFDSLTYFRSIFRKSGSFDTRQTSTSRSVVNVANYKSGGKFRSKESRTLGKGAITNARVCSISKSRHDRNAKKRGNKRKRERERDILLISLFILGGNLSQQSGHRIPARMPQCLLIPRIPSGSWKCHFSGRKRIRPSWPIVFLSFYKKEQRRDAKANDARHGKLSPYRSNPLSWIPDTGMSHRMWVNQLSNRERSGQTENLLGIWMVEENCSCSKDNWQIRNK